MWCMRSRCGGRLPWTRLGLVAVLAGGLAGCAAKRPVYELSVRGQVQSLTSSGSALVGDFIGDKTYVWDWANLGRPPHAFEKAGSAALLGPRYVITEMPADPQHPQPVVVAREQPAGRVVRQWPLSAEWYCSDFCSSVNGRYVGILLEEGKPTGGDTCLGLIGPGVREIPWVAAKGRVVKLAEDGMAISNTGQYLALLGLGDLRMLTMVDLQRKRLLWRRSVPRARSVAFSPDGSVVYVGGHFGICALKAGDGKQAAEWLAEPSKQLGAPVTRLAASPDGCFVAAGTDLPDGQVYLLHPRTGAVLGNWAVTARGDGGGSSWSLQPKKTIIEGLAFSPSGKLLATADSASGRVRIWQMPAEAAGKSRFPWLHRRQQ